MNAGRVRRRRFGDAVATAIFWAAGLVSAALVVALATYIVSHGAGVVSWHFLTAAPDELRAGGGIGPEIFNSFYILGLTLLFTVPLAVASAVYLEEYAHDGPLARVARFSVETLAAVPSIVMGLFGLVIFVYLLRWRFSALGGALTLTLLNLPTMLRVTQQALGAVPVALREGSLALGATRWQTIVRVVLPASIAALTTGVVLVAGRIFGETAALIYTAGVSVPAGNPYDAGLFHPAETLSVHLWYAHAEGIAPDVGRIGDGSAAVLLGMVLLFNLVARGVGAFLRKGEGGR